MDWKATRRTGHPYVRVYSEERERPVLLVVDQRLSMFFGSKVNMKSVTAAQAAALAAWRVLSTGDRVGAVLFNDSELREFRPQRSKTTVMRILRTIVAQNRALGFDLGIVPAPQKLDEALRRTVHLAGHDYLVCIISDFFGLSEKSLHLAKALSRHNDLVLLPIYDPLAKKIPDKGLLVVSDGENQIPLDGSDKRLAQRIPEFLAARMTPLADTLSKFGVPQIPIDTVEDVAEQIRTAIGKM